MITRALLRTKAAQVLYAGFLADNNWKAIDNELIFSINKYYNLYHLLLLLPLEIVKTARKRIQISLKKHIKSEENLKQDTKLSENLYAAQLSKNRNLLDYAEKNAVTWLPYQKEVLKVFNILQNSDFYKKYIDLEENSFETDKNFWIEFYKSKEIFDESFDEFLEEVSIYWLDEEALIRSFIVKTINSHRKNDDGDDKLLPLFKDVEDKKFVSELVRAVYENNEQYNLLINSFLRNWQVGRLTKMDVILLKMAIAEIELFPEVPVRVTINEYIEISKYYGTEKSSGFINGVLDNFVKQMKDSGNLRKDT